MTKDMDTAALRCFATAVRTGSMGRAAEALERTQPAISQQIRRLEDILGCRLVRRTARGVIMTAEGEAFLPLAERILALNDEAQAHVRSRASATVRRRRIGLIEDVAASGLQMALADFAQVHPDLELDVMVAEGEAMREAFGAGKLDLALADTLLIGAAPRRRRVCPLVWVAAPTFDPTERDPLPLVLFRHPCEWRVRTVQALDQSGRRWRTAFESGSLTAIQAAVRAGVGVATLLPGNVEFGMTILDPGAKQLPTPPDVELALYRRSSLRGDAVTDVLEGLLWKAVG
ncbi:MAG TPA: LysR family transcriptional regulator [Alphaproteobacteria bacterium]|nr:LysR family transcriptional regulator [Alphaproteobacteria bacterium]